MPNFISEDDIEQALLQRLQHGCGFDFLDCHTADPADVNDGSGRKDKREVLLPLRLKAAALRMNPQIPEATVDEALARLADRRQEMRAEDERHVREGLTEDELEIFDLMKKDAMTQAETQKVKVAAKALLHRLQDESPKVLVQDWYKTDQTRRIVRTAVAEVLDRELPVESYDRVRQRVPLGAGSCGARAKVGRLEFALAWSTY